VQEHLTSVFMAYCFTNELDVILHILLNGNLWERSSVPHCMDMLEVLTLCIYCCFNSCMLLV